MLYLCCVVSEPLNWSICKPLSVKETYKLKVRKRSEGPVKRVTGLSLMQVAELICHPLCWLDSTRVTRVTLVLLAEAGARDWK